MYVETKTQVTTVTHPCIAALLLTTSCQLHTSVWVHQQECSHTCIRRLLRNCSCKRYKSPSRCLDCQGEGTARL